MLPEEVVELAREDGPHITPAADSLDDDVVQQARNPIFEVLRQRLFTVDGIKTRMSLVP